SGSYFQLLRNSAVGPRSRLISASSKLPFQVRRVLRGAALEEQPSCVPCAHLPAVVHASLFKTEPGRESLRNGVVELIVSDSADKLRFVSLPTPGGRGYSYLLLSGGAPLTKCCPCDGTEKRLLSKSPPSLDPFDSRNRLSALVELYGVLWGAQAAQADLLRSGIQTIFQRFRSLEIRGEFVFCVPDPPKPDPPKVETAESLKRWVKLFAAKECIFIERDRLGAELQFCEGAGYVWARLAVGESTALVSCVPDNPNFLGPFRASILVLGPAISAGLFSSLYRLYHVPRSRKASWPEFERFRTTTQIRVCNVLVQWTKKYASDFLSPTSGLAFIKETMQFVEEVLAQDHVGMAKQIRKNLVKLKDLCENPSLVMKAIPMTIPKASGKGDPSANVFLQPPEEVARQLTLIEFNLFSSILVGGKLICWGIGRDPSELLNQAWTKSDATTRAPNIVAFTRRFNAVACWTAKCLHGLNNFSTLMAFIAGLNKACITRLKLTAKELPSKFAKKLADFERLMTAEGSFKNYRACIRAANPPCIPYM
ncbi:ras guanine nucleotide exchange factor domain-containing protein, partial [Blyttiomyces helicus]